MLYHSEWTELYGFLTILNTAKPVKKQPLKIDKTKILMTNGSLMKVESIAECILQYF